MSFLDVSDSVDITKTHIPTVTVVVIAVALVGAAFAVAKTTNDNTWEVRALRDQIAKLVTKDEVDKSIAAAASRSEDFTKERVKFYLEHAALRVSPVPGKRYLAGRVEFPIKDDAD